MDGFVEQSLIIVVKGLISQLVLPVVYFLDIETIEATARSGGPSRVLIARVIR